MIDGPIAPPSREQARMQSFAYLFTVVNKVLSAESSVALLGAGASIDVYDASKSVPWMVYHAELAQAYRDKHWIVERGPDREDGGPLYFFSLPKADDAT